MKKSLIFVGILAIGFANAQEGNVGINTDQPKATLDIQPSAENAKVDATTNQGIIIPKLSKARVMAIATTNLVEGTKVYVTDDVTAADTQFIGTGKGFYFYNGTKWVKQLASDTDTNSELWAQRDNAGVTETYLKPATANRDEYFYSNKESVINLGNLTQENTRWADNNDFIGIPTGETPHLLMIDGSKLPTTSSIGNQGGYFHFSRDFYNVTNQNASTGTPLKRYMGKEHWIKASGINTPIGYVVGSNNVTEFSSSSSADQVISGRFFTKVGDKTGVNHPKINTHAGILVYPHQYSGTTNFFYGIHVSPQITGGKISQLRTGNFYVASSVATDNVFPTMNYDQVSSVYSVTMNKPNTTTKVLSGAHIRTHFENQSVVSDDGYGVFVRGDFQTGSSVKNYAGVNIYLNSNGAADMTNLYGIRLTGTSTDLSKDFKPTNMYGIHLQDINNGIQNNYAIYTNAGKVRVGDLAQSGAGDRVVYADANGVLKTGGSIAANNGVQTQATMECNEDNRGKMNFVKDITLTGGGKADAFAVCLKGSDGNHYWRYLYGAGGETTGSGNFGTGLQ